MIFKKFITISIGLIFVGMVLGGCKSAKIGCNSDDWNTSIDNFRVCMSLMNPSLRPSTYEVNCPSGYGEYMTHCYKPVLKDNSYWKFERCPSEIRCLPNKMINECFVNVTTKIATLDDNTEKPYYELKIGISDVEILPETKLINVNDLRSLNTIASRMLLNGIQGISSVANNPDSDDYLKKIRDGYAKHVWKEDIDKLNIWYTAQEAVLNNNIYNKVQQNDIKALSQEKGPCYKIEGDPAFETDEIKYPIYIENDECIQQLARNEPQSSKIKIDCISNNSFYYVDESTNSEDLIKGRPLVVSFTIAPFDVKIANEDKYYLILQNKNNNAIEFSSVIEYDLQNPNLKFYSYKNKGIQNLLGTILVDLKNTQDETFYSLKIVTGLIGNTFKSLVVDYTNPIKVTSIHYWNYFETFKFVDKRKFNIAYTDNNPME